MKSYKYNTILLEMTPFIVHIKKINGIKVILQIRYGAAFGGYR